MLPFITSDSYSSKLSSLWYSDMDIASTLPRSSPCSKEEDQAYEKGEEMLDKITRDWSTAKNELHRSTIDSIKRNLVLHAEKSQQRARVIDEMASSFPSVAAALGKDNRYKLSQSHDVVAVNHNIMLSYKLIGENAELVETHEAIDSPVRPPATEHYVKSLKPEPYLPHRLT